MIKAPIIAPKMDPTPPVSAVPPMIVAAITDKLETRASLRVPGPEERQGEDTGQRGNDPHEGHHEKPVARMGMPEKRAACRLLPIACTRWPKTV